jgi:hypothetical protein
MVRLVSRDTDSVLQLLEAIQNLIKFYFLYQAY